jgi:glycosyltransferase involved in cell wall biosynthesis
MRLCLVTTSPLIVDFFLHGHLRALQSRYDVTLAVNTADPRFLEAAGITVDVQPIPIERKISPGRDLVALAALWRLLRRARFDAVISIAPKAGLLTALAAWLAGVPVRCHIFQGEVWANRSGAARALLRLLDKITASLATHVLVISASEREFLVRERVVSAGKAEVIANGSLAGVDLARFRADESVRRAVRARLGVPDTDAVVLFLGRLTRDKGVLDLARAVAALAGRHREAHLVLVGPDEDDLRSAIERECRDCADRLHFHGLSDAPEQFIAAADVIALPSHREGFGNVIIEAAAAGVPAVASRIYGIQDAVIDGETGLLHPPGDVQAIAGMLEKLIEDPELRRSFGARARERAAARFSSEIVTGWLLSFLQATLAEPRASPGREAAP